MLIRKPQEYAAKAHEYQEAEMKYKTRRTLKNMIWTAILLGLGTSVFYLLYRFCHKDWALSVAITMLTFFYHFAMRLTVGETVTLLYRNKDFPQDRLGFRLYSFEDGLYRKLKVNRWKTRVITAKPEQFDLNQVSPGELLHNVMQAELVHRIIMVLSFVPLLLIIPFGVPWVFIITSTAACLIDGVFVMIQRYNRPKVLRYIALKKRKK